MTRLRHICRSGAIIEEIDWVDPEAAFLPFGDETGALWLDSADPAHDAARCSFIARRPYDDITCTAAGAETGFQALHAAVAPHAALWDGLPAEIDAVLPPFRGGAAGLFGYDLGLGLEPSSAILPDAGTPALALGLYATVLAFDHRAQRAFIIATGLPADTAASRADAARAAVEAWKTQLTGVPSGALPPPEAAPPAAPLRSNFTAAAYKQAVADTVEAILAGEIFQANLAQRFDTVLADGDSALAYYRRLRRAAPAPFAAYAKFSGFALASASPERFLLAAGGTVETRPIKGTEPRGSTAEEDAAIAEKLLASEKNRAENVMIVDLLRNDLAKSCEDTSIHVTQLCALESFSNVHHLVSTVRGRLSDGLSPTAALQAAFPGGSITGAPKIRAMQLIAEAEKTPRGASYGSLGYVGFDGRMDTSIIIRTARIADGALSFHVGGGIVADSEPAAEYAETLNKARGLMAALGTEVESWAAAQLNAEAIA